MASVFSLIKRFVKKILPDAVLFCVVASGSLLISAVVEALWEEPEAGKSTSFLNEGPLNLALAGQMMADIGMAIMYLEPYINMLGNIEEYISLPADDYIV